MWIKATKKGIYIIKKEIENFFFKEERIKGYFNVLFSVNLLIIFNILYIIYLILRIGGDIMRNIETLKDFLFEAKQNTFIKGAKREIPSRPNSKDYAFKKGFCKKKKGCS